MTLKNSNRKISSRTFLHNFITIMTIVLLVSMNVSFTFASNEQLVDEDDKSSDDNVVIVIQEGFEDPIWENSTPAGWENTGWLWDLAGNTPCEGDHFLAQFSAGTRLTTPEFQFGDSPNSNGDHPGTLFSFQCYKESGAADQTIDIYLDYGESSEELLDTLIITETDCTTYVLNLSSYSGRHTVSIILQTSGFFGTVIDDILVTAVDNQPPEIKDILATPSVQLPNNNVNITCSVTDKFTVDQVFVNVTYPDLTEHSYAMNVSRGVYYFNQSYVQTGTYNYEIWANDTVNNINTSSTNQFIIDAPPEACFIRGDVAPPCDQDGSVTMGDGLMIIGYYIGDTDLSCLDAADVNDDGVITMGDGLQAIGYYIGDSAAVPMAPFPDCGVDPTDTDDLNCDCHMYCMDCDCDPVLDSSDWMNVSDVSGLVGEDGVVVPVYGHVSGYGGEDLDAVTVTLEWDPLVFDFNMSVYEVVDPVFESFFDVIPSPDLFNVEVNDSEGWAVISMVFSYVGSPDVPLGTYRMCDVVFDVCDGVVAGDYVVSFAEDVGSPAKNPTFTYGYTDVAVTELNDGLFTVEEVDQPPTACFSWVDADGSGSGSVIDFDAGCSTDDDVGIVSYEWDFDGDGDFDDATGVTVSYDWGDYDSHIVGLRVTDTASQTDTVSESVQAVVDQPPTACFSWVDVDGSGSGSVIDFDAGCSTDDDAVTLYEWDFDGDGDFDDATGVTVSYDWGDDLDHIVGLKVTDSAGKNDTFVDTVQAIISNAFPEACFTWFDADGSGDGTIIYFDAGCSSDDDAIVSYEWDWENDGIIDYVGGPTVNYDYGDTDLHQCTLRVTDTSGQMDTVTLFVSADYEYDGDMNGDGTLNSADVRYLALYLCGNPMYTPLHAPGDVNSDGVVNSGDVRYLGMYLTNDPDYSPLYP